MHTELISIETDTLPLDGAFHRPDGEATAGAVLLFHRNTSGFLPFASVRDCLASHC
jgi:hypothetical protein